MGLRAIFLGITNMPSALNHYNLFIYGGGIIKNLKSALIFFKISLVFENVHIFGQIFSFFVKITKKDSGFEQIITKFLLLPNIHNEILQFCRIFMLNQIL